MFQNIDKNVIQSGCKNKVDGMKCTNDKDVVELVDSIDLGEQLVDNCVMDSRTASDGASRLTDGVYLIKDDDV